MKMFKALLIPVLCKGSLQLINGIMFEQFSITVLWAKPQWYKDEADTDPALKKLAEMESKVYLETGLKLVMPSP